MPNVLNGIELDFTSCLPASSARACSSVLSLFILLHLRCVSLQFAKLYGSPPRETGMSSSTSALIGCGVFNVLSTGLPQMAHTSYAASTLCLSMRRRYPLLTRSLRRLLMVIPSYEVLAWPTTCRLGIPSSADIPSRGYSWSAFGGSRTRAYTRPQGRGSEDLRPVRSATDSYEGMDRRFEHHRITEARDWLACRCWCMPTLTWVGGACPICRSDRTGYNPRS